jgi:hypothetical protein
MIARCLHGLQLLYYPPSHENIGRKCMQIFFKTTVSIIPCTMSAVNKIADRGHCSARHKKGSLKKQFRNMTSTIHRTTLTVPVDSI